MAKKVTQPSSRAARVGTSVASGSTGGDDHRVNAVGAAHTPTPLDPWELEGLPTKAPGGCECTQSPAPSQTPRPTPTEARPKGDDCCKQIIEILRCLPGIDEKCLHIRKPKTPPKVKMANLHGVLPIKERIVPTLNLVLRRLRKGVPAGNVFEQKLQTFLTALPTKQRAALDAALDGYDALPAANREGVFETRFDNWSDGDALDPDFIARNVVGEFIALGRYNRFGPEPPPFPSPLGRARGNRRFRFPASLENSRKSGPHGRGSVRSARPVTTRSTRQAGFETSPRASRATCRVSRLITWRMRSPGPAPRRVLALLCTAPPSNRAVSERTAPMVSRLVLAVRTIEGTTGSLASRCA
jgi:hypothetical protein